MATCKFSESDKTTTTDAIMGECRQDSEPATEAKSESGKATESKNGEEGAKTPGVVSETTVPWCGKTAAKWRAALRIMTDVSSEKLWAVAKDFCNLEWCSMVSGCVLLEGDTEGGNTVGTVRHCTSGEGPSPWFSDEKLVAIDHEKLSLTYEMLESSFGWLNYRATLSVGRDPVLGKNFVELNGEQSPQEGMIEEENVRFMEKAYNLFLSDLESKARSLQLPNATSPTLLDNHFQSSDTKTVS